MAYFNNPRTEEELNNQFRQLLIKNNYRDPQNQKLVAAIRKEYDERLLQIKRANGYQTTGDKVKNFIEEANAKAQARLDEMERAEQAEKQRIAQLQNKKFSKQDLSDLLDLEKRYIDQIIHTSVQDESILYLSLKAKSKVNDYVMLYQFFVSNSLDIQNIVPKAKFNAVREELEYAVEYLSANKKQYEKVMLQVEEMMGKKISELIIKYEEIYVDPIRIQETDSLYNKNKRGPQTLSQAVHMFLTVPAWAIAVVGAIIGLTADPTGLALAVLALIWIACIELYYKLVVKRLEKKRNRVRTYKQARNTEKKIGGIGHIISALIRAFLG